MTANEKRIRAFEIIIGVLLLLFAVHHFNDNLHSILYDIGIEYITWKEAGFFIIPFIADIFMILCGVMIISRCFEPLWLKIAFGITGVGAALSSEGIYLIMLCFDDRYSAVRMRAFHVKFFMIASTVIKTAAIVVALLSMCGVIKWRSRRKLLVYAYIMVGLSIAADIIADATDYMTVLAIMLPCFMQGAGSETKKVSIIGEVSLLLTPIFRTVAGIIYWLYCRVRDCIKIMATGINPAEHVGYYHAPWSIVKWGSIILLALIPLMAFGRKFTSETESAAASAGTGKSSGADNI